MWFQAAPCVLVVAAARARSAFRMAISAARASCVANSEQEYCWSKFAPRCKCSRALSSCSSRFRFVSPGPDDDLAQGPLSASKRPMSGTLWKGRVVPEEGLTHRSERRRYSITSSALSRTDVGRSRPERPGHFEIDYELDLGRLLDRRIPRGFAPLRIWPV